MAYRPLNLSALQIGVESGGQQFDETGQPLKSKKGALGIAQVMPKTAPEAARLAGIPWDPQRYANDRDYNLQLGDAYQGYLDKRFGKGSIAATAAYNAGPTKVANLMAAHGEDWARNLPPEARKYVKNVKGIDVGEPYYTGTGGDRVSNFADDILSNLGVGLKPYGVNDPGKGDRESVEGTSNPNEEATEEARTYSSTSDRYKTFLENAVQPLHDNAQKVVQQTQGIADTKHAMVTDFAAREADLEAKITPLQQRRQAILDRLVEMDAMSPFERKLKSAFNSDWDPRVLRGRLDRIENSLQGHEKTYQELNTLRSGVATVSIDATNADTAVVNAQSSSILADGQLLGQITGAVRENVNAKILPYQVQVESMRLDEAKRQGILGRLTLEDSGKAYNDAQNSQDGTTTIDGVKFAVGDLQKAFQSNQAQDLSLRSMKNSYQTQDLQTADLLENNIIEHMTPEQVTEAMKAGGQYRGYQLSMMKLAQAGDAVKNVRENQVNEIVLGTAYGQAANLLHGFAGFLKLTGQRSKEMFGNTPDELTRAGSFAGAQIANWQKGFDQAKTEGVGREYIAQTAPQLQAWQSQYDAAVDTVAKKWGGGKPELEAVASAYLRGNPLSGDAATKGLITMARSGGAGMAKLSGPALQAFQVAQAVVKGWDQPAGTSGDSLSELLKTGTKKDSDLMRIVQDRVGNAYAAAVTDQLMNQLPTIARSTRDPNNPGKVHPFATVNKDDFIAALRHGDNDGFTKVGQEIGLNPQQTQTLFAEGVDGPTWAQVKQAKGYNDNKFSDLFMSLQSVQMAGTLAALDASHSARPGFSPAKAFVDFLQNQDAQNQVDGLVANYGKSTFGSFLASSAVGGGYRDAWSNYGQSIAAVYTQLHSTQLRDRIRQQRSIVGDPFTRMNAVLRASDLTAGESQTLLNAVRPLAHINNMSESEILATGQLAGSLGPAVSGNNFDALSEIIKNHKFDDPHIEQLRKRAAKNWDAMQAVVGNVADSLNE